MPQNLVTNLLEKAPASFELYSRDRKNDLQMGQRRGYHSSAGTAADVIDFETGMRRPATLKDIGIATKVIDSIRNIEVIFSPISASDVPSSTRTIDEYATTVKNTTKHVHLVDLNSPYEAEYIINIAAELVGGLEKLIKQPIVSDMFCVIAPLTIDISALATVLTFARAGLPVSSVSMPLAGGTAPVTPAGALALSNAEVIGAIAVIESFHPRTPIVYTPVAAVMDPGTGELMHAPEALWMQMAMAQLASYYQLPCSMAFGGSSSRSASFKAGYEITASTLLSKLAGADIFTGLGLLDNSRTFALDQLLIDSEICSYVDKALSDAPIDEDAFALDVIAKVGPTGHFLAEEHTRRHVNELWRSNLLGGNILSRKDRENIVQNARGKVREILRTHHSPQLAPAVQKRIENIVHEAHRNCKTEVATPN
jgi:trimethylamine--corrinoid protein Co-methyltransferase